MLTNYQLQSVRTYFSQKPVVRAYLFGSQARLEADAHSDVDLLVDLEQGVTLFEFARIQLELEELLTQKVDLISSQGLHPRIRPYVERDKRLIYEKSPR
ncbi:MAG: nucleotidyltransferase domain-containing protein [Cytophagaceae bacterium]|nr:nucleotidyltransferase domain-containing protein [Cytophagaceae bacterium]